MTKTLIGVALFVLWCVFILWLACRGTKQHKVVDLPKNRRVLLKPRSKSCDPLWPECHVQAGKLGIPQGLCSGAGNEGCS